MKKAHSVSPFLILLMPALLVIGYKSSTTGDLELKPEKQQAAVKFQMPCLKGMIRAIF